MIGERRQVEEEIGACIHYATLYRTETDKLNLFVTSASMLVSATEQQRIELSIQGNSNRNGCMTQEISQFWLLDDVAATNVASCERSHHTRRDIVAAT